MQHSSLHRRGNSTFKRAARQSRQEERGLKSAVPKQRFSLAGPCLNYPHVIHQYDSKVNTTARSGVITVRDITADSCLNGWTCGNIAATPGAVARFYFELFQPLRDPAKCRRNRSGSAERRACIVSTQSLAEMLTLNSTKSATGGWFPAAYGLGLMPVGWGIFGSGANSGADEHNDTFTIGHSGGDWGSEAWVNGYNAKWGRGLGSSTPPGGKGRAGGGRLVVPTTKEGDGSTCVCTAMATRTSFATATPLLIREVFLPGPCIVKRGPRVSMNL